MATQATDFKTVLTSDHPAKPYYVFGGVLCLLGLLKNNLSGLVLLGLGGAILARGYEEVKRTEELHDGNVHGTNAPPVSVNQ